MLNHDNKLTHYFVNTVMGVIANRDEAILLSAKKILSKRLRNHGVNLLEDNSAAQQYLHLWFKGRKQDITCCLFLDQSHCLIDCREMFCGAIDENDAYIQDIARQALVVNASAVICASHMTRYKIQDAETLDAVQSLSRVLGFLQIRFVDHINFCGDQHFSFRENGLI